MLTNHTHTHTHTHKTYVSSQFVHITIWYYFFVLLTNNDLVILIIHKKYIIINKCNSNYWIESFLIDTITNQFGYLHVGVQWTLYIDDQFPRMCKAYLLIGNRLLIVWAPTLPALLSFLFLFAINFTSSLCILLFCASIHS